MFEEGGIVVLLGTSVSEFEETEADFRTAVANAVNDHCSQTTCWSTSKETPVRPIDVVIYEYSDTSTAEIVVAATSVSVSFYVKSPLQMTQIALTSEQLEDVIQTYDQQLEEELGYAVEVDTGPTKVEKEHLLEPWITSIIVVAAVSILVALFVVYMAQRNKKKMKKNLNDEEAWATGKPKTENEYNRVDFSATTKQSEIIKETGWSDEKNADTSSVEEAKENEKGEDEEKSEPGSSSSVTVKADVESSSASGSQEGDSDEAPPAYQSLEKDKKGEGEKLVEKGDNDKDAPSSEGHDNPAMEMEEKDEVKTDDKKTEEEEEEKPKETTSL